MAAEESHETGIIEELCACLLSLFVGGLKRRLTSIQDGARDSMRALARVLLFLFFGPFSFSRGANKFHIFGHLLRSGFWDENGVWMSLYGVPATLGSPPLLRKVSVCADGDVERLRRVVSKAAKTCRAAGDQIVAREIPRFGVREGIRDCRWHVGIFLLRQRRDSSAFAENDSRGCWCRRDRARGNGRWTGRGRGRGSAWWNGCAGVFIAKCVPSCSEKSVHCRFRSAEQLAIPLKCVTEANAQSILGCSVRLAPCTLCD